MNARARCIGLSVMVLAACLGTAVAQTTEDLLAVRAGFAQALDDHDLDTLVSFLTDDFVWDYVALPTPVVGPEALVGVLAEEFRVSPDWHTDQGRVLSTDGVVVVQHAGHGTQTESRPEFPDVPPSGNVWVWPHIDIYEFVGDKINRLTTYADHAGIFIQIGLMPAPEMPALVPSIVVPDEEPTGLSPVETVLEHIRRWNSHDAALVAQMYPADYKVFVGPMGAEIDREAMTALNEMYFSAFPNVKLDVVRTIDLGDGWVLAELVSTATHQGTFMGVPAAGYPTELRVVWLMRITADGLMSQGSFYYDNLTLMTQMTTAPFPLDGIWMTVVPTPLGNLLLRCTYTAQDAAKTRFNGELEDIGRLPLFVDLYPEANNSKWAGGEAVVAGRNKYEATFLQYHTKTSGTNLEEIVGIATIKAYFELPGMDRIQGHGTGSYYLAAQDADQDGFPDDGEEPAVCLPWSWTSRRLTAMPGSVSTPMP